MCCNLGVHVACCMLPLDSPAGCRPWPCVVCCCPPRACQCLWEACCSMFNPAAMELLVQHGTGCMAIFVLPLLKQGVARCVPSSQCKSFALPCLPSSPTNTSASRDHHAGGRHNALSNWILVYLTSCDGAVRRHSLRQRPHR
jgi:hypothetical protein